MVTRGYNRLHEVTRGYKGFKGSQGTREGYKGLKCHNVIQSVREGLQEVARGYKKLQGDTRHYKG